MTRIVFFGSDEIALPALEHIRAQPALSLTAVFSQPDRPAGRGQKTHANAIVSWAENHAIPAHQPARLDAATPAALHACGCDLALVMAYGHILKRDLLSAPPLGFFNLHASLLPGLRGATPIEGAIAEEFAQTGVTLQRIVPRLDAGPVVDAQTIPMTPDETRGTLREKITTACVPLLQRALPRIINGTATEIPQDESAATFTRKITREDSAVDFHASAREIAARVRALNPWPGVVILWEETPLKIGAATPLPFPSNTPPPAPGTLLSAGKDGIHIATGNGILRIRELQRPAGKMLPAHAFIAGFPMQPGTALASKPMPPLVTKTPRQTTGAAFP
ncbi:MAG: methionyl-tRNA formyltransferase [Puniceicoccales bacterium]|jgi:methionyl-tRNA formyltransferase|nr:methionyl-tRNA formyltransferase [Puniceicoccales bacterium]